MRYVKQVEIHTGETFDSEEKARRVLHEMYGNKLLELTKKILNLPKTYSELSEYLDTNSNYLELHDLMGEMKLALNDRVIVHEDEDDIEN